MDLIAQLRAGLPGDAVLTDPDVTGVVRQRHGELLRGRHPRRRGAAAHRRAGPARHAHRHRAARPGRARRARAPACRAPPTPPTAASCSRWSRWTGSSRSTPSTGSRSSNPASSTPSSPARSTSTGLYYPPDPSSWEQCSIGGNIGTASGGLCCVKYGVTAEYVLGLDVVLADGRLLTHRPAHRQGRRGLRPHPAVRRLRGQPRHRRRAPSSPSSPSRPNSSRWPPSSPPPRPPARRSAQIMARGHAPSLLELMDRTSVRAVNDMAQMGLPDSTEALLLAAFDTPDPAADLAAVGELCTAAGATEVVPAETAAESDLLLQARRLTLTALERVKSAHDDRRRLRAALPARRDARRHRRHRREARPHHRRRARTPATATPTPPSASTPPTPTSPAGPASPSTTSWRSASNWAARSPASTASAC